MNFEEQIEKELKTLFGENASASDLILNVSGEFRNDFTSNTILITCNPRQNISGGLWDAEIVIYGLSTNGADFTGTQLQAIYSIIANIADVIKKDPSLLNATMGTLSEDLTAAETITELKTELTTESEVLENIPDSGNVKTVNQNGEYENIAYSAFDENTGIFTVNHLMVNSYKINDKVKDLNIYAVDGVVNQASTPMQLDAVHARRSLSALLKISYTP